ncbi:MAG: GMC family oxidoreductase, partial [Rhizobiales bacterium]|nr:GMC family oxidoreductase [Hyphomicrobiales bacterium]
HSWRVSGLPEFDWGIIDRDRAGRRGGRPIRLPRGRLVGGSSMVNSTIAVRPASFDMDRWAGLGCPGWDWQSLLPLFRRIETDRDFGDRPVHGNNGPIVIQRYPESGWAPVNRVFVEACAALGVPHAPDLNDVGFDSGVFGTFPHNRFKEAKQGTLNTYLRTARPRPNLTIRGSSVVDRVLLAGHRAAGVTWVGPGGREEARAERVIVAAGVYNSPLILQRSGIGPAELLRRHGISVVADLPAGRNLTDHPGCAFFFRTDGISAMTGRLFATTWRGAARENGEPYWHTHPFPADEEDGLAGLFTYICRQQSSGTVEITGRDPGDVPLIDHDYLAAEGDIARFGDAYEGIRALLATGPFARANAKLVDTGQDFASYLKTMLASAHHQSSSCRMGSDPAVSVVGPTLRVHGIDGLMVADSSVFPDTVMHNTNLTCYVVGERAAAIVRAA